MLIARLGLRQLGGFVIDVVVALRRTIDAIGPVQSSVEPLRAVRRGALSCQHVAHLVKVCLCIGFGGEVSTFPAPIRPRTGQTVKNLLCANLTRFGCVVICRNRTPEEFRNALFLDLFQFRRNAGLAEILLCDDIRCNLAPTCRDLNIIKLKDNRTVRITNLGRRGHKFQLCVCIFAGLREFSINLHLAASFPAI